MELILVILISALATGACSHLYFIAPMMKKLLAIKPNSFAAKHKFMVPFVSFFISSFTFPLMILILLSDNLGAIFSATIEESFGQE